MAARAFQLVDSVDYDFADEYRGPPLPFAHLPQALPIDLDHIPLASVAPSFPASDPPLPVVLPLPSPKPRPVSPTSVVDALIPTSSDAPADTSSELKDSADGFSNPLDTRPSTASSQFSRDDNDDDDEDEDEDEDEEEPLPPSPPPPPPIPRPARRPVAVKFGDESHETGGGRREDGEKLPPTRPRPRKGACYRCLKGNRFTEKEVCVVCGAKYCAGCVLRAMGSMPEGRKCVGCIGCPVEEARREGLGRCSRMLRRLLSPLEVEQAMRAERTCEANQLRPERVILNGRPLSREEMAVLRACGNPPAKLKPGNYWYDKVSGLWGKEGSKPHLIISPHLNIGGSLLETASNGNTGVFINGRNITKSELRMLQFAGVQCAGNPHFWVNSDGTYQEEGMKNVKGNLWGKPGMKLVCSLLSLPHPSKLANPSGEVGDVINRTPGYIEKRSLQKLLLIGCHGSGTSTILKQAKFLYNSVPFSEEERGTIKVMIQTSIYYYLCILLEGRERFEEEWLANRRNISLEEDENLENEGKDHDQNTPYSISTRLKVFSDWLLKVMASGNLEAIFPAATREYAPLVEELWKDPAIQATYDHGQGFRSFPTSASYFLERVVDISRLEYEPSDRDILYANGAISCNGLAYTEFIFPHTAYDCSDIDDTSHHETIFRYQLIRVQSRGPSENKKWLEMFEDARLVIFCAALSDYNEYYEDPNGHMVNKMLSSKLLFESILNHPTFDETNFLLILTKFDLLEKKIDMVPLTVCEWFDDYNPVTSHQRPPSKSVGSNSRGGASKGATAAEQAFHYIAVKFKRLYASIATSITRRKLYVTMANALDAESVDRALRYAREVSKWEDERAMCPCEFSTYSTDPSSLSD